MQETKKSPYAGLRGGYKGGGRHKKNPKEVASHSIRFLLTEFQKNEIRKMAEETGLSLSQFILSMIFIKK